MNLTIYVLIGIAISIVICAPLIKENYLGLEGSDGKASIGLTIIVITFSWPFVAFVFSFWLLSWLMGSLVSIFVNFLK